MQITISINIKFNINIDVSNSDYIPFSNMLYFFRMLSSHNHLRTSYVPLLCSQKCPNGFFTCKSGSISCIEEIYRCSCSEECRDGSDEDSVWASCSSLLLADCGNVAPGT